jgi:cytochrome c oxidase subunit 1
MPVPTPEYNFAQTPLVRGLDALYVEKAAGNGEMTPAEPVGEIHMPNGSILPFFLSLGMFVAGFGFIYSNWIVAIVGLGGVLVTMFLRSVIDDHGYHIHKEEVEADIKGGRA